MEAVLASSWWPTLLLNYWVRKWGLQQTLDVSRCVWLWFAFWVPALMSSYFLARIDGCGTEYFLNSVHRITEWMLASSCVSVEGGLMDQWESQMCPWDGDRITCIGWVPNAWGPEKVPRNQRKVLGVDLQLDSSGRLVLGFAPAGSCISCLDPG